MMDKMPMGPLAPQGKTFKPCPECPNAQACMKAGRCLKNG